MGARTGTSIEPRNNARTARRSSKPRRGVHGAQPDSATGLPTSLLQRLSVPPPPGARHDDGVVLSLSIGQARDSRWFDRVSSDDRLRVFMAVVNWLEAGRAGTPKLVLTKAGYLTVSAWGPQVIRRVACALRRRLPRNVAGVLGIDEAWNVDSDCSQVQSMVGVYGGRVYGPIFKFYPATTGHGYEALRKSVNTCRYSRRLLPTAWVSAYGAVCHDIFGLAGIGKNYNKRVSDCEYPPSRLEVSAALPRASDPRRHPQLVLNAIHAITKDEKGILYFGRFQSRTGTAARAAGAPVISAAGFVGIDSTRWSAARRPDGTPLRSSDVDWWAREGEDWIWLQGWYPRRLGLTSIVVQ
jgi:hypothetical protein